MKEFFCLMLMLATIGIGIFGAQQTGRRIERKEWQKETVKRGLAEYNSTTAEWQWKGEPVSD